MPLIPADTDALATTEAASGAAPTLTLSEPARAMASVETVAMKHRHLARDIRATGKIQYNETTLATVTSRVDGYIERLFVDYTGITVDKGAHLVNIYSPELVVAQRELLLAQDAPGNTNLIKAARKKLLQWEITEKQIDAILATRKLREHLTILSPVHGTVVEKLVVEKSAVKAGDVLYRLADLRHVWAYLDIYEYEIGLIQYGQRTEIRAEAYPGDVFTGRITFLSPILDEATRTIKGRVNVDNPHQRLKPGMFVYASIHVPLLANGKPAPTGVEGQYACPMHPEIIQHDPGTCPICGMDLRRIPGDPASAGAPADEVLAVPVTAVLDSGTRTLVYVEKERGKFAPVAVQLGPRTGDFYPVLAGLQPGDRVVVRGNFLLDSQFQIRGLPSLLSPDGSGGGGHDHSVTPPQARQEQTTPPSAAHRGH
jgi:Cu(I)/Ag(I) efflux system membrane fusion protein